MPYPAFRRVHLTGLPAVSTPIREIFVSFILPVYLRVFCNIERHQRGVGFRNAHFCENRASEALTNVGMGPALHTGQGLLQPALPLCDIQIPNSG